MIERLITKGQLYMKEDLKLFVWEGDGVLTDWSSGMICVLAKDLEQAVKLIKEKVPYAEGNYPVSNFKVIEEPEAFIVWGGG